MPEAGMTASLGVTAAFELSWEELDEKARSLAAFLSLFAPAEIPWWLVQACISWLDEEELEELRDDQLVKASLLSFEGGENYQLHQLLREFFGWQRTRPGVEPEDEEMKRSFCAGMASIGQQIPQTVTLDIIEQFKSAIPHLKEAATTLTPWLTDEDLITPATRMARFYEGQSAFGEAEEWTQQCLAIATQRLGADHPDVATSLNNLAVLYANQGRLAETEPLLVQALALRQKLLGSQHPDTVRTQQSLGILRRMMGQPRD